MNNATLLTVTGPISIDEVTVADAHAHVWIDPPDGVAPEVRIELRDRPFIAAEVRAFGEAGGRLIVDCQPEGCGRNAACLAELSAETGVFITATTGFHQRKFYPEGHWLWRSDAETAARFFRGELTRGMRETGGAIPATTLKVGYEGTIDGQTRVLMEAAADAAHATGAVILFHTEQGRNVEALLPFFSDHHVPPSQLYLCHVDKRPDFGLHAELAQAGVLLGYDTLVRPKYNPDATTWPLLRQMAAAGHARQVAIGQDLAFPTMWQAYGGEPGLLTLLQTIRPRLAREGFLADDIANLTGANVTRHLVRRSVVPRNDPNKVTGDTAAGRPQEIQQ